MDAPVEIQYEDEVAFPLPFHTGTNLGGYSLYEAGSDTKVRTRVGDPPPVP
jgi:hypothetical protein